LYIPVSICLARGVTSPIPISETSRTRTQFGWVFLNVARMLQGACHLKTGTLALPVLPARLFFHRLLFGLQIGTDAILVQLRLFCAD
jgi:hypothetical protein